MKRRYDIHINGRQVSPAYLVSVFSELFRNGELSDFKNYSSSLTLRQEQVLSMRLNLDGDCMINREYVARGLRMNRQTVRELEAKALKNLLRTSYDLRGRVEKALEKQI